MENLNPSSPKGGVAATPNSFHPGVQKLLWVLFILAKIFEPTTFPGARISFQSWEVRGLVQSHDFKFGYFENIWSDMQSKLCLQIRIAIFLHKNPWKIAYFHDFTQKSIFVYILHDKWQFLEGMLTVWRHSDAVHLGLYNLPYW